MSWEFFSDYSCCSCIDRIVHGRRFLWCGIRAVYHRGESRSMICYDNGDQFVGVAKMLPECIENWNMRQIAKELPHKSIKRRMYATTGWHL